MRGKKGIAITVTLSIFGETVLASVNFDGYSFLKAGEIDDVRSNRDLAAKVKT